jgi:hypothetical protein
LGFTSEIQKKTGLPYGTLYRKLKDPFKIEQPRVSNLRN